MSKEEKDFKDLLEDDVNHALMSMNLLRRQVKLEEDKSEISNAIKQKIALVHMTTEQMVKRFVPEHLKGKNNAEKNRIREANEKIRELEKQIGKDINVADMPKFVKAISAEIRKKCEDLGLWVAPEVSVSEYSINIDLKHIGKAGSDIRYAMNEDEIEEIKEKNFKHKVAFEKNFDVSEEKQWRREKIKMTSRNISMIKNVMHDINNISFQLDFVSNGEINEGFNTIETMKFSVSIDSIAFPKMYYGD